MSEWIEFNIHDTAAIRVARNAPTASLLEDMLRPFLAHGLGRYDLTITSGLKPMQEEVTGEAHGETEFGYTETALQLHDSGVQIARNGQGYYLAGSGELLVYALPLIDWIMVTRGCAMIHAATVSYCGQGIVLPAWGGSGKTSTMAKLLKLPEVGFMGDDWAFLSAGGELLGYPKPMFIKPYHRAIYPHLFAKRHKPLVPVRLSKRLASLTTLVHPVITKYPRLARITRNWSPEHMMVTPQRAFPGALISERAPLALAVFVERHDGNEISLKQQDRAWMVSRLVGNFYSEVTRQSRLVSTALGASGLVPLERAIGDKAAILSSALEGRPSFLLRVPKRLSPDQASDVIVEYVLRASETAGLHLPAAAVREAA